MNNINTIFYSAGNSPGESTEYSGKMVVALNELLYIFPGLSLKTL